MSSRVYLDHAATTPMFPEAVAAMTPFFTDAFANPSGSHRFARTARRALDEAREQIAGVIGVDAGGVVFTAGGTESDNTAIRGVIERRGGRAVCPAAEHHAVVHPVEHVTGTVVAVDNAGAVDLDRLGEVLDHTVSIVSVMAVNNEVGTITDLAAVASLVRERSPQAVLHTDAVQAPTWLDLRPIAAVTDMISLSAHKFGGPKGVGILTVRDRAVVAPLLLGGGQERDLRSGTHNLGGIVATAAALSITDTTREDTVSRVAAQRNRLVDALCGAVDDIIETVPRNRKVAGSAHLCIAGIESESLLFLLDEADLCASAASACASGAMEASHVLAAMGVDPALSRGALRLSLGHDTTDAEIDRAIEVLSLAITRLRRSRCA